MHDRLHHLLSSRRLLDHERPRPIRLPLEADVKLERDEDSGTNSDLSAEEAFRRGSLEERPDTFAVVWMLSVETQGGTSKVTFRNVFSDRSCMDSFLECALDVRRRFK